MTFKKTTCKAPLSFQNQVTRYLFSQIQQQKQVLQCVKTVLPTELAKQVRCCLIKDKNLLIYTDSAVWASQLRFYSNAILLNTAPLIREGVTVVQIKVITRQAGVVVQSEREARLPSAEKITQIQDASLGVTDESLQLALLKLSKTLARLANKD